MRSTSGRYFVLCPVPTMARDPARLVIRRSRNLIIRRLSQRRPRVERSTEAWKRLGPHPGAIDMGGAAPPLFS